MTKTYRYVSLIKAKRDNPVWDDEEGELTAVAGKRPETYHPKVHNEETDRVEGYSYERVDIVELPERMKAEDAFDYVRSEQPGAFEDFYQGIPEAEA